MRVVAQGSLDRQSRELHLMLAHLVYWRETPDALVLVFVTGDTFLVRGEERVRVLGRLEVLEEDERRTLAG